MKFSVDPMILSMNMPISQGLTGLNSRISQSFSGISIVKMIRGQRNGDLIGPTGGFCVSESCFAVR
jgi:hypothetical protein